MQLQHVDDSVWGSLDYWWSKSYMYATRILMSITRCIKLMYLPWLHCRLSWYTFFPRTLTKDVIALPRTAYGEGCGPIIEIHCFHFEERLSLDHCHIHDFAHRHCRQRDAGLRCCKQMCNVLWAVRWYFLLVQYVVKLKERYVSKEVSITTQVVLRCA